MSDLRHTHYVGDHSMLTRAALAGMDAAARFPRLDLDQKWPLYVHYIGGRVSFTPRDTFVWRTPSGPSDCVWMVPDSWRFR